jgi:two-component system NarL family sensor kinase
MIQAGWARVPGGSRPAGAAPASPDPAEVSLSRGERGGPGRRPPSLRRLLGQAMVAALVLLLLLAAAAIQASRHAAEQESINDAVQTSELVADTVMAPVLVDDALSGVPAALARLEAAVRSLMSTGIIIRVKLWTADGQVVYSDEPRLIGRRYGLDPGERKALAGGYAEAGVSDLSHPENEYERGEGRLLEVYRPVTTREGTRLLLETYTRYTVVTIRADQIWHGFAGITLTTLSVMIVLMLALGWTLSARLHRSQRQREQVLARAAEAGENERRRIAAALHDGVVQELVAISYVVSAAVDRAASADRQLADRLEIAASGLRTSIGGLRSLLVDVYPPALRAAGITTALTDLTGMLRLRGIAVDLDLADRVDLDAEGESLVFRIAQEIIRNTARHAGATRVRISLCCTGTAVALVITDDGVGFDPRTVLGSAGKGHFGLALMSDLAREAGADLTVASAPGQGTRWRLEVPPG